MFKSVRLTFVTFLLVAHSVTAQESRPVQLMTPDDVGISAAYFPVGGDSVPAVLLLHSLGQNRDEWTTMAALLQRHGIAALSLDLRGHGESTRKITALGPQRLDFQKFTARDFTDMMLDLNAAFDWLAKQPNINRKHIGVIGTSFGANLALRYATFNEDVAALLLFSPGLNYNSVRTDDVMKRVGPIPLRIIVARYDTFAYESSKRLFAIRKEQGHPTDPKDFTVSTGHLHGLALLTGVANMPQSVLDWLQEKLAGHPTPAPEPAPPAATPPPPAK